MTLFRAGTLGLGCMLLVACNSSTNTAYQTISLAISGPQSTITTDVINRLGKPALIARLGQNEALLVLAARYNSTAEWHGPNQLLVTRNGRLVQSAGAPDNSDILAPLVSNDPFLTDLRTLRDGDEVTRLVDYPKRYLTGLPQHALYTFGKVEPIEIMGVTRSLQRINETIHVPALGFDAENVYWMEPETGKVLASLQHLYPGQPALSLTEVSPSGVQP